MNTYYVWQNNIERWGFPCISVGFQDFQVNVEREFSLQLEIVLYMVSQFCPISLSVSVCQSANKSIAYENNAPVHNASSSFNFDQSMKKAE